MTFTRTKISEGPNGFTLVVRSTRLPSIYAQRAKLPSVLAAHVAEPELQEHVGRMVERASRREGVPS